MPIVNIKCEPVEITSDLNCAVHSKSPQALQAPGGLYPLYARAFQMDEYRLRMGWPVPVPDHDIRCNSLLSCTGEVIADRDPAITLRTEAAIRWVADEGTWDITTLQWSPTQTAGGIVPWTAVPSYEPVLVDYEYRVNDERFYTKALNFDSDTKNYLSASFEGVMAGNNGYTLIMVMSPNSTFGNNTDVPYNGLWSPQDKSKPYNDITIQGRYLYQETESHDRLRGISVNGALEDNSPFYIAIVFDRPYITYYVGTGPTQPRVESVPSGDVGVPVSMDMFLGRSTEDLAHTTDMALLDLGIYSDKLTGAQVVNEFSTLSQAYGGA